MSREQGSLQVVVAPVLRFVDAGYNADVRIQQLGSPEKIIRGFAPELFKDPLEEDGILETSVEEHDGLQYYYWWALRAQRATAALGAVHQAHCVPGPVDLTAMFWAPAAPITHLAPRGGRACCARLCTSQNPRHTQAAEAVPPRGGHGRAQPLLHHRHHDLNQAVAEARGGPARDPEVLQGAHLMLLGRAAWSAALLFNKSHREVRTVANYVDWMARTVGKWMIRSHCMKKKE